VYKAVHFEAVVNLANFVNLENLVSLGQIWCSLSLRLQIHHQRIVLNLLHVLHRITILLFFTPTRMTRPFKEGGDFDATAVKE